MHLFRSTHRPARPAGRPTLAAAILLALVLGPATPAPAAAQDPVGLTFVGGLAYEDGGPGPSLVDALRAVDLADERPTNCRGTVCIEGTEHPFYFDEGLNLSVMLGARYRFEGPVSIELLFSNGQRGHAEGYDHAERDHLVISYASFMLTGTVGLHLGPIRLEAGPVLNSVTWESTFNSVRDTNDQTFTLGGTAGASASVRVKDVLLSLKAGVRGFPSMDVRNPVQLPIQADYQSFLIGVTAIPLSY